MLAHITFSVLQRAWLRYLSGFPGQLILSLSGIALGIAVVVSIDLAKQSALEAFVQATETISGKASYRIVGNAGSLDERLFPKLRLAGLPFDFLPKIEGYLKIDRADGEKLRLLGVDPFQESDFGSLGSLRQDSYSLDKIQKLIRILTRPDHVIVSKNTAIRLGIDAEKSFAALGNGHHKKLTIAALPDFSDKLQQQAMEDLILTDIASAQEILETIGRISYIDVLAHDQINATTELESLQRLLPKNVELISYERINQNARELTASFYTNLTALSLLSVLVGMFLIFNTINFLTMRRRGLIGILRALGASRAQVFKLVLGEAAVLGWIGTLSGLLLGAWLAHALLQLIGSTIDNVYFNLPPPKLTFSVETFVEGLLLGTLVSVVSAIGPAVAATRVEAVHAMTRSKLESHSLSQAWTSALLGIPAICAGVMTTIWSGKSVAFGFTGLMLLVVGCALFMPLLLAGFSRVLYPLAHASIGFPGALAVRSLGANLSRGGLAVAALMVAIAATIGVQIMVTSFRTSVADWLDKRIGADLYITAVAGQNALDGPLNQRYFSKIVAIDKIRSIGTTRRRTLQGARGTDHLHVHEVTRELRESIEFISKPASAHFWDAFANSDWVIVTESYAWHHELNQGAMLSLMTDHGARAFLVAGIYRDYNPGPGLVTMSRPTYLRHWQDNGFSALSVYAQAGTDLARLERDLKAASESDQVIEITRRDEILKISMAVFDQAFAVTDILQWLAAIIAFLGVFSVLTAIQLDRVREYGVLRALGVTSRQLAALIGAESALMGLIAGLLAIPVGLMIALVLVFVINQRTFGWSIGFAVTPTPLIQGLISAILAAMLAGLIPAWRMARLKPAEALRNE